MPDRIPESELQARLDACPEPLSVWQYCEGGEVCIVSRCILEATLEPLVAYCYVDDRFDLPIRMTFAMPLADFLERFTRED